MGAAGPAQAPSMRWSRCRCRDGLDDYDTEGLRRLSAARGCTHGRGCRRGPVTPEPRRTGRDAIVAGSRADQPDPGHRDGCLSRRSPLRKPDSRLERHRHRATACAAPITQCRTMSRCAASSVAERSRAHRGQSVERMRVRSCRCMGSSRASRWRLAPDSRHRGSSGPRSRL